MHQFLHPGKKGLLHSHASIISVSKGRRFAGYSYTSNQDGSGRVKPEINKIDPKCLPGDTGLANATAEEKRKGGKPPRRKNKGGKPLAEKGKAGEGGGGGGIWIGTNDTCVSCVCVCVCVCVCACACACVRCSHFHSTYPYAYTYIPPPTHTHTHIKRKLKHLIQSK